MEAVLSFMKSLIRKFQNVPDSLDEMNIILKRHWFEKNLYFNSFLRFDFVIRWKTSVKFSKRLYY